MTVVSLCWYIKDADDPNVPEVSLSRWVVRIILLMFQLGPVLRYCDSLYYGIISRRYWKKGDKKQQQEFYTLMLYEESDCVLLRLFECFMEAAPQLVLQLYILTQQPESEEYGRKWEYVLFLGCITSLLSLAWGVTAYARCSRFTDAEKDNISISGTVVIFLWHIFCIGARVTAMVLFASRFQLHLLLVCAGHWILMVVWLMAHRSLKKACPTPLGECILSFILGAVYIFTFINVKDEQTRTKYVAYYTLCGIENLLMVILWLIYADSSLWYYIPGVVFHFFSFALGITFMSIYYRFLHPTVPHTLLSGSQNTTGAPSGFSESQDVPETD
ncbi:XK-related protein 6-like isoform X2 [Panulirus ornatus]